METYYAYLRWCTDFNERNLIDPAHDKMEWNHTLPQCIFGDQPIGQWLTLKQHAIASALQTLAFKRSCICGFHKNLIPSWLWDKVSPFYSANCRDSAKKHGLGLNRDIAVLAGELGRLTQKQNGTQSKPEVNEKRSASLKQTLSCPKIRKERSERIMGDKNPMFGRTGELHPSFGIEKSPETKEKLSRSKKGTRRWVNDEGKWIYRKECPGPEWKLAKPHQ